jgi:hypothetical protein
MSKGSTQLGKIIFNYKCNFCIINFQCSYDLKVEDYNFVVFSMGDLKLPHKLVEIPKD